jgi:fructokinase
MDRPIIFGEVLFDRFPDGESVLGGAPFNVAWHLQGFGLDPHFISQVGTDALGDHVLEAMQAWGMSVDGIEQDSLHPTGQVEVSLSAAQPSYAILPDQAYDYIDSKAAQASIQFNPALLYHGSLALRGNESRHALDVLWRHRKVPCFIDINLRPPWYDISLLREALDRARWLKLNEDDLTTLQSLLKLECKPTTKHANSLLEVAAVCQQACTVEWIILTLGDKGAYFVTDQDVLFQPPTPVEVLVDTVGAGDAFSAVTLLGIILSWQPRLIQERAIQFASAVCGQRGATTKNSKLYEKFKKLWRT